MSCTGLGCIRDLFFFFFVVTCKVLFGICDKTVLTTRWCFHYCWKQPQDILHLSHHLISKETWNAQETGPSQDHWHHLTEQISYTIAHQTEQWREGRGREKEESSSELQCLASVIYAGALRSWKWPADRKQWINYLFCFARAGPFIFTS